MALGRKPIEIVNDGKHQLLSKAEHWDRIYLKEVAKVQNGYAFSSDYFTKSDGMPLIRIRDIDSYTTVDKFSGKYNEDFVVKKGDILIGMDGDFKTARWKGENALLNQRVCRIIPNSKNYNDKFLVFCLQPFLDAIHAETSSVTVKHISSKTIEEIPLPLPPKKEQDEIVSKIEELFSELDKGIENLRLAQQQLKTYRQSVLKWAFEGKLTEVWRKEQKSLPDSNKLLKQIQAEKEKLSETTGKKLKSLTGITEEERTNLPELPDKWTWVKLGDNAFVTKLAGFEFTKYVKYKEEGEVPVIRAQNVSKTSFIPRNFLYVDREIMEKLPRSRVYGGEILMVFVGAGLGNVGIVPEKTEYFLGPNVAKIALEKQFNNKYIFHFLTSQLGFANVTGMSKATAQGSISMGNIREVSVPLISIEEQKKIVREIESRLSVADKMEESITQSLQQAEALRQSILKKAFEGKLI